MINGDPEHYRDALLIGEKQRSCRTEIDGMSGTDMDYCGGGIRGGII